MKIERVQSFEHSQWLFMVKDGVKVFIEILQPGQKMTKNLGENCEAVIIVLDGKAEISVKYSDGVTGTDYIKAAIGVSYIEKNGFNYIKNVGKKPLKYIKVVIPN